MTKGTGRVQGGGEDRGTDWPGNELLKEYREIVTDLVRNQGWRYRTGGGHPKLYPSDPLARMIPVPTTPGDSRSLKNFVALVRRNGGHVKGR